MLRLPSSEELLLCVDINSVYLLIKLLNKKLPASKGGYPILS
jgi:hypothetical protein